MAINPGGGNIVQAGGQPVQVQSLPGIDAELVFLQSRGDIRVGVGVDIRVDTDRHGRACGHIPGNPVDTQQLRLRFHVETADAGFQGAPDFIGALADPGKHHLARVAPGNQHPLQFPARHDVETRTQPGQEIEDGQVAVCLYGVADQGVPAAERVRVGAPVGLERRPRIDVGRRAVAPGERLQGNVLRVQRAVVIRESFHVRSADLPRLLHRQAGTGRPSGRTRRR